MEATSSNNTPHHETLLPSPRTEPTTNSISLAEEKDQSGSSEAKSVDVNPKNSGAVSMEEIVASEMKHMSKRAKRRIERIEIQKEKKKIKKAEKREEREKMLQENPRNVCPRARGQNPDPVIAEQNRQRNRARKDEVRNQIVSDSKEGPIIVFDMTTEWELAMKVAERASLSQQLMYSYGNNKRCIKPARLLTTGLPTGGIVDKSLHKHAGKQNWLAFDFSSRPLEEHLDAIRTYGKSLEEVNELKGALESNDSKVDSKMEVDGLVATPVPSEVNGGLPTEQLKGTSNDSSESTVGVSKQDQLVEASGTVDIFYLTADTDNVLEEVPWNKNTVYVIGAIVDRNRMTRAAISRAEQLGVKPVCLPLAKYCDLTSTKVLTVNHCVELLQRRGCGESWEAAFENTLPTRKEVIVKNTTETPQLDEATKETSNVVIAEAAEETVGKETDQGKPTSAAKLDHTFSRDVHVL